MSKDRAAIDAISDALGRKQLTSASFIMGDNGGDFAATDMAEIARNMMEIGSVSIGGGQVTIDTLDEAKAHLAKEGKTTTVYKVTVERVEL